jgi:hypothetical protein
VGWLLANSPNDDPLPGLVHIVENAMFADAQLPNWFLVIPRRLETHENLLITGLLRRRVLQLVLDLVQDSVAVSGAKLLQVVG